MAKAIFTHDFHWSRPGVNIGFAARAGKEPQTWPADFIAAAVEAGAATEINNTRRRKATKSSKEN